MQPINKSYGKKMKFKIKSFEVYALPLCINGEEEVGFEIPGGWPYYLPKEVFDNIFEPIKEVENETNS
jgi:hypothetical protein